MLNTFLQQQGISYQQATDFLSSQISQKGESQFSSAALATRHTNIDLELNKASTEQISASDLDSTTKSKSPHKEAQFERSKPLKPSSSVVSGYVFDSKTMEYTLNMNSERPPSVFKGDRNGDHRIAIGFLKGILTNSLQGMRLDLDGIKEREDQLYDYISSVAALGTDIERDELYEGIGRAWKSYNESRVPKTQFGHLKGASFAQRIDKVCEDILAHEHNRDILGEDLWNLIENRKSPRNADEIDEQQAILLFSIIGKKISLDDQYFNPQSREEQRESFEKFREALLSFGKVSEVARAGDNSDNQLILRNTRLVDSIEKSNAKHSLHYLSEVSRVFTTFCNKIPKNTFLQIEGFEAPTIEADAVKKANR